MPTASLRASSTTRPAMSCSPPRGARGAWLRTARLEVGGATDLGRASLRRLRVRRRRTCRAGPHPERRAAARARHPALRIGAARPRWVAAARWDGYFESVDKPWTGRPRASRPGGRRTGDRARTGAARTPAHRRKRARDPRRPRRVVTPRRAERRALSIDLTCMAIEERPARPPTASPSTSKRTSSSAVRSPSQRGPRQRGHAHPAAGHRERRQHRVQHRRQPRELGALAQPWPLGYGLACCAIEMMSTAGPHHDLSRFG